MTTMIKDMYDALIEAGTSETRPQRRRPVLSWLRTL